MQNVYNFEWTASSVHSASFFIRKTFQRPVANKEAFSLLLMVALKASPFQSFTLIHANLTWRGLGHRVVANDIQYY